MVAGASVGTLHEQLAAVARTEIAWHADKAIIRSMNHCSLMMVLAEAFYQEDAESLSKAAALAKRLFDMGDEKGGRFSFEIATLSGILIRRSLGKGDAQ